MKELLKKLLDVKKEIFKYFGLKLNYYPIYNYTDEYWRIDDESDGYGQPIEWGPTPEEVDTYCEDIYNKCIYCKDDYTMVLIEENHHNEVYHIFDNSKEVK